MAKAEAPAMAEAEAPGKAEAEAEAPGKAEAEQPKKRTILEKVKGGHNFHQYRKDAQKRPVMAQDTLCNYAVLNISVVKARKLTAADWSLLGPPESDPFCQIYVNDGDSGKQSPSIKGNINPVWNWDCELAISRPGSIIRLNIMDEDLLDASDLLGYVEFPVADIPYDKELSGWFILSDPKQLQKTAPERVAKMTKGPVEETCGAVYLKIRFNAVSKDPTDEFYAWCLPQPTFETFPEEGFVRDPPKTQALDAQFIIDQVMDIKEYAFDDMVIPFLSAFLYIFEWREVPLSLFCLLVMIACSLRPLFYPAGFFFIIGTVFLLLKNRKRRLAMYTHPMLTPLNDAGFKAISALQDTGMMVSWIERLVGAMDGSVVERQRDMLRRFCAFAQHHGEPSCTFDELRVQLQQVPTKLDEPFLTFDEKTYPAGCLVASEEGKRVGEVVKCVNPREAHHAFKYMVKFAVPAATEEGTKGSKEKGKKEPPKFVEEEVPGQDLELRLDFRWVSNSMVLAMIPDVTESLIMEAADPLKQVVPIIQMVSVKVGSLFQWHNAAQTMAIVIALYIVAAAFAFVGSLGIPPLVFTILLIVQNVVAILITTVVFLAKVQFVQAFIAQMQAMGLQSQHKKKPAESWAFVTQKELEKTDDDNEERGTGGSLFGCWAIGA